MKTKQLEEKIEEIMPNLHSTFCNDYWYSQRRKPFEKRECFCGGINQEQNFKNQLLSLFHDYAMGIIGKDDDEGEDDYEERPNYNRNLLRAEQRKRI
jgi:hypothetical protein